LDGDEEPAVNETNKDDDPELDSDKLKKSKDKTVMFDEDGNATQENVAPTEEDVIDFQKLKKKKTKKKKTDEDTEEAATAEGSNAAESLDPDYTYDELLNRVYNIMREKNPDMVTGEKRKFMMRPPQVMKAGSKKTAFANFADICKLLKRQPKHLLAFLLAELGTSGSIDGSNQLIIKGRFQQKHIENVLRKYIKEYVTCHTCKSAETMLQKDTRLFFLQCETCGSRCSVASIKTGFQALTTKRAATRNAATTAM